MSEEQIIEALGAGNEDIAEEVIQDGIVEDIVEDDLSDLSPVEKRAWGDGWRPQEQFEGNPDNWKSAEAYNLYGEFQGEIRSAKAETRRIQQDADDRITNLNKLHEAQTKAAIADLKNQQREAVSAQDVDEFDRLQVQIEEKGKVEPVTQSAPAQDPAIAAWEQQNPWVNDPNSEKGQEAIALFNVAATKPNATAATALAYVDSQLAKLYPDQQPANLRREMPTMTEQSRRPSGRQRTSKELSMSDLTPPELKDWDLFGKSMFTDEKQFLKSVADARKQ